MQPRNRRIPAPRGAQAGVSIVELMIAIALGLIILAALATLFANSSRARSEMERSSRQLENGRFATQLLGDDLRLAGFYGELAVTTVGVPGALQDPCSNDPTVWTAAIRLPMQAYDNASGVPGCVTGSVKPNTDVLVVRRVAACEAGVAGCPGAVNGQPYLQASKCDSQLTTVANSYRLGRQGEATFDRKLRNCTANAGMRRYFVNIYFISTDNGQGQNIPTLMRMEFNGDGFDRVPLVEGIEELNLEYGIDTDNDGQPNAYTADPTTYNPAGCCTAAGNWSNVVAVRINLLARNTEPTYGYTDPKTYTLGLDAAGNPVQVTPADAYKRHEYNTVVRVVNVSQRKETP